VEFHLSLAEGRGPLSRQIYEQIRAAIITGRLRPGDRVPPSRALASTYGISRNTVSAAIDRLTGEGLLSARAGVGTFVSADARFDPGSRRMGPSPLRVATIWSRQPDSVPQVAAEQPRFDFRPGIPDTSRFPYPTWRRCVSSALRSARMGDGLYGDPAGHAQLRQAVARHLAVSRGARVEPGNLLITSGVQQAAALACQVLIEPGDVVAMEDPGYLPVRRTFEAARAHLVDVPVDEQGIIVEALPKRARAVYVSPAHQFPLGVVMSLPRRLALLDWARRTNAAIIEDDYDSDFRYVGRPVDPLQALDTGDRVLYVGSFSKSMLPALRLGYCVVPFGLVRPFQRAKFVSDWHSPLPEQLALTQFIADGHLIGYIRRSRREYQERRDRIEARLDKDFRRWMRRIPTVAGLHLSAWTDTADHDEVEDWVRRARDSDIAVHSLQQFTHGAAARPGLVFGFGGIPLSSIDEGLERLQRIMTS
jgi:GntR family transcriptional regulator / MocR family aminotransferase